MANPNDLRLSVVVTATTDQLNAAMQQASQNVNQLVQSQNTAAGAAARHGAATDTATTALGRLHMQSGVLTSALHQLSGVFAAMGLAVGVKELIDLTNEYQNLQGRIRLVTGEGAAFTAAFAGVRDIAKSTYSDLKATGDLFTSIANATRDLGVSQEQQLALTKAINQAVQVSGASTEAAAGAITQLGQALASGTLRGDEFNSINEQTPRIMQALADGLGVARGALRGMAEQGQLTSDVVLKALLSQSSQLTAEFEKMPVTAGKAMAYLSTSFTDLIGSIDEAVGSNKALGEVIVNLADWVSGLGDDFARLFGEMDPELVATLGDSFERIVDILRTIGQAAAEHFTTVLDLIGALSKSISVMVGGADEDVSLLVRTLQGVNIVLGVMADGVKGIEILFTSVVVAVQFFAGAVAHAWSLITFGEVSARFKAAAEEMFAAADQTSARTMRMIDEFSSSTGKAITAAVTDSHTRLQEAADKSAKAYEDLKASGKASAADLKQSFAQMAEASLRATDGVISDDLRKKASNEGYQLALDESGKLIVKSLGEQAAASQETATKVETAFGESTVRIAKHADQVGVALKNLAKDAGIVLPSGADDADKMALALGQVILKADGAADAIANKMSAALKGMDAEKAGQFMTTLAGGLQKAGVSGEQFGLVMRSAAAAAAESIGVKLPGSLNGLSDAFSKSMAVTRSFGDSFEALGASGINASHLIKDSLDELLKRASNPAEINAAIGLWEEYGRNGVISNREVGDAVEAARLKIEQMTPGINGVTEAMKLLGLETKQQIANKAKDFEAAYSAVLNSGQATSGQMIEALRKTAQAAYDAGHLPWLQSQAEMQGLTVVVDNYGKVSLKAFGDSSGAARSNAAAVNEASGSYGAIASATQRAADGYAAMGDAAAAAGQQAISSLQAQIQKADELASKLRGAQVNSAGNLSGVSALGYGSADAVKALLLSSGYSGKDAASLAKDIFQGSVDEMRRQPIGQQSLTNAAIVEREVQRILAYNTKGTTGMIGSPADYGITAPATPRVPDSAPASTTRLELVGPNGQTVTASVPQGQDSQLIGMLTQLGIAKKLSGA